MSNQVEWAKRIAALAKTGLHYAESHYDEERYRQLMDVAAEMLADASESDVARVQLILTADEGYITPKVDVRGAVFREGKVLLVREAFDGAGRCRAAGPMSAMRRRKRSSARYGRKAAMKRRRSSCLRWKTENAVIRRR